jgi:hypothetical protein
MFAAIAFMAFLMLNGRTTRRGTIVTYTGMAAIAALFCPESYRPATGPEVFGQLASIFTIMGFPFFLFFNIPALASGWNYVFEPHPAEPIVGPAVEQGRPLDATRLANTLVAEALSPTSHPTYHWENQADKARTMSAKLDAARAEVAAADRALQEARRRAENAR